MKIEQNTTSFKPVTLTIESKDELALLTRLLGATNSDIAKEFNIKFQSLCDFYNMLEDMHNLNDEQYPLLKVTKDVNIKY